MTEQFARPVQEHGPWIHPLLRSHGRALAPGDMRLLADISARSRGGQLIALDIPGPARGYAVLHEDEPTLQLHVIDTEGDEAMHALFGAILEASAGGHHVVPADKVSAKVFTAIAEFGEQYGIFLSDDRRPEEMVRVYIDYADGANDTKVIEVEKGATIERPSDPAREGATFDGWFEAEDSKPTGRQFDFGKPIEGDVGIIAVFTVPDADPTTAPDGSTEVPAEVAEEARPESGVDDDEIEQAVNESKYAKMRRGELEKLAKERSIFIPKKIDDLRRALFEHDAETEPFED